MAKWRYLLASTAYGWQYKCARSKRTSGYKSGSASFEIYALALNIRGDSTIGDLSADVDVDPSFIMDHLDMTAMVRLGYL